MLLSYSSILSSLFIALLSYSKLVWDLSILFVIVKVSTSDASPATLLECSWTRRHSGWMPADDAVGHADRAGTRSCDIVACLHHHFVTSQLHRHHSRPRKSGIFQGNYLPSPSKICWKINQVNVNRRPSYVVFGMCGFRTIRWRFMDI